MGWYEIKEIVMGLSKDLLNRLRISLTSTKKGDELAGYVGIVGGFRTDASTGATVLIQDGGDSDGIGFNVLPESGIPGAFKIYTTGVKWTDIKDIKVSGFVPKSAGANGDAVEVQVTGYNVANQYISIAVYDKATQVLTPTPNFVIGFRIAVALLIPYTTVK